MLRYIDPRHNLENDHFGAFTKMVSFLFNSNSEKHFKMLIYSMLLFNLNPESSIGLSEDYSNVLSITSQCLILTTILKIFQSTI
jgi:hypothetical protein